ncbi:TetR/AcrR family transcriptional regulator [Hephaestia sp. GCM10023244]|uniref:TetR/AcrR family transcriptional regulator n=1 Tax=unclassified Hephaestia TaxID=2631281 RepID=UPI0020770185|nr:TetR family transcriptional regulator [Hephaestia sp. MAHUQ-44]MCM8731652.1 TetR family transcriptional regulator [Hephaestia sp. MAHUQ-44]
MNTTDSKSMQVPASKRPQARNHKARVREASIERILDAAEQLFAEFGYHGVTLKDVAARIGVSSTLIHYHFNGKESIYEAIWARKAPVSVHNRLEAMRLYAETVGDDAITVEGALHAWIDADLNVQIEDPETWAAFGKIAAQANSAAGWGAEKMTNYFNPVVLALIDLLKKAMPDCDEQTIFWAYHFVSGAMTHNMSRTGRLDELSHGLCSSDDFVSIKRHMATFMAAGIEAICRPSDSKR